MLGTVLEHLLLAYGEVALQHPQVLLLLADVRLDQGLEGDDQATQAKRVGGRWSRCDAGVSAGSWPRVAPTSPAS